MYGPGKSERPSTLAGHHCVAIEHNSDIGIQKYPVEHTYSANRQDVASHINCPAAAATTGGAAPTAGSANTAIWVGSQANDANKPRLLASGTVNGELKIRAQVVQPIALKNNW